MNLLTIVRSIMTLWIKKGIKHETYDHNINHYDVLRTLIIEPTEYEEC